MGVGTRIGQLQRLKENCQHDAYGGLLFHSEFFQDEFGELQYRLLGAVDYFPVSMNQVFGTIDNFPHLLKTFPLVIVFQNVFLQL